MKKLILAAVAAATMAGASAAATVPGEGDLGISGPYSYAIIYYNEWRRQVGYEVTYCDGSTERELQPGENIIYIEIDEGTGCVLDPLDRFGR